MAVTKFGFFFSSGCLMNIYPPLGTYICFIILIGKVSRVNWQQIIWGWEEKKDENVIKNHKCIHL